MAFYPINLNISGQLCVVIGGGAVARRKINSLLCCAATIRLISPAICAGLQPLIDNKLLEWRPRAYMPGDLQGARLAFALTDRPEVQAQIEKEAQEHGIPINIGDNPAACTFQTAATVRHGDLLISVSTGGNSPALAAAIRKELELHYGPEYGELVKLLGEVRILTKEQHWSQEQNKLLVEQILQTNILTFLKNKDWHQLQAQLIEILPQDMNINDIVQKVRGF